MTFSKFQVWLQCHPEQWARAEVNPAAEDHASALPSRTPASYREFLEQIGPLLLLRDGTTSYELFLMGDYAIADRAKFVYSFSQPEQGIVYTHLIPFCDLGFDNCYYCFAGEHIVEFDPSVPDLIHTVVAPTFGDFLDKMITERGL